MPLIWVAVFGTYSGWKIWAALVFYLPFSGASQTVDNAISPLVVPTLKDASGLCPLSRPISLFAGPEEEVHFKSVVFYFFFFFLFFLP